MAEAEEAAKQKRRVPKGTSAYQAAWIVDDEGSGDEDDAEYEELVDYASDQDHPHTPGTIAESEFGGMTEFVDAETDAMEVRQRPRRSKGFRVHAPHPLWMCIS